MDGRTLENRNAVIVPVYRGIKNARLTYLNNEKIARSEQALKDVCEANVRGCFIECGIALGGSRNSHRHGDARRPRRGSASGSTAGA